MPDFNTGIDSTPCRSALARERISAATDRLIDTPPSRASAPTAGRSAPVISVGCKTCRSELAREDGGSAAQVLNDRNPV